MLSGTQNKRVLRVLAVPTHYRYPRYPPIEGVPGYWVPQNQGSSGTLRYPNAVNALRCKEMRL